MRVALVRVRALLERDREGLVALEGHVSRDVVDARADEVEVVDVRLVLDLQRVGAGGDFLGVLAVLLDLDLEARADLALELARSRSARRRFGRRRGGRLVGRGRARVAAARGDREREREGEQYCRDPGHVSRTASASARF